MARPLHNRQVQLTAIIEPAHVGLTASFTLFKPTGGVVGKSATTNTAGQAVVVFPLNRKTDKPGVYRGRVVIIFGSSTLSAEASVVVQ